MIYSDINNDTPFRNPLNLDIGSVMQSIRNIIRTRRTEVLFLPEFGFDEDGMIFEHITDVGAIVLFQEIVNSITFWDDRILLDLNNTNVTPDIDNNAYKVSIYFRIRGLDDTFTLVENVGR